jgi:hypothetical protein
VTNDIKKVHEFCNNQLDTFLKRMDTKLTFNKKLFVAGHSSSNQAVVAFGKLQHQEPISGYILIDPVDCVSTSVFRDSTRVRIDAPVLITEATLDPMYVTDRSADFFYNSIEASSKILHKNKHFSHSDLLNTALVRIGAFFHIVDSCESPKPLQFYKNETFTQKEYRGSMAYRIKQFIQRNMEKM